MTTNSFCCKPYQHCCVSVLANLIVVRWYTIGLLICSLVAYDIGHLFIYLFAIFIHFDESSAQVLCPFINRIIWFHIAEFERGHLYLSVTEIGKEPVFYGDSYNFGYYTYEIQNDGRFRIEISGKKATGIVEVTIE